MQHTYEDNDNLYVDQTGNEFYDTIERLIQRFQTLDQKDKRVPKSPRVSRRPTNYNNPKSGVAMLSSDDERNEVLSKHRLQRTQSLNREAALDRGQQIQTLSRHQSQHIPNGDAFITIHDSDSSSGRTNSLKQSPFVRGAGVRRTFSGISRPYFSSNNIDNSEDFDDSRSDNYRVVSHSTTISDDDHINGDLNEGRSRRSRKSKSPSKQRSVSMSRYVPDKDDMYDENLDRGYYLNGDTAVVNLQDTRIQSPDMRRKHRKVVNDYSYRHKKPVEYVPASTGVCFPLKKSKKQSILSSKHNPHSYQMPNDYTEHSDYDENSYMNGHDSLFDSEYDSSVELKPIRKTYRSPSRSRPRMRDDETSTMMPSTKDKRSTKRQTNYKSADITNYSIGPEPRIRLTKEGYKFIELDVDVSGFRPEDIQIVTQGNLLQVIAKGAILKKGSNNEDTRIYRELKRQFSLTEVVNAEYLHGVLTPGGVLEIRGPVGVTGNTKKLKRKKVKFHLDN